MPFALILAGGNDETVELVRRSLDGDQAAKGELMTRVLCPIIQRRAARRLGIQGASRQELTDWVQDVLVHLLERDCDVLRRWDPQRAPLAAYVSSVTKNFMVSKGRRKPQPASMEDPDTGQAPESGPEAKASFAELYRRVQADLSDDDGELFHARYMEGLSPNEIAEHLGITRGATYKRLERLRDDLRDRVSNLMASKRTGGSDE